jgi:hypothetical protein
MVSLGVKYPHFDQNDLKIGIMPINIPIWRPIIGASQRVKYPFLPKLPPSEN